jgi:metal-responsive CopG/Arc/MetJ family transcriptional regulator
MYNIYIMHTVKTNLTRTQIYLSEQQQAALDMLSKRAATTRSQLIRLAIEKLLAEQEQTTTAQSTKRARLDAIAGSWAKRSADELNVRGLREGWSRHP